MFGYVRIRKPELKVKDFEQYHGVYCGLCSELKRRYGFLGQITLTYDMTFLILLLSSVYDIPFRKSMERCIVHPGRKHMRLINEVTGYAADINILLSYYHFKDDSEDEHSKRAWAGTRLYQRKKKRVEGCYARQSQVIRESLLQLSSYERAQETYIWKMADCFGNLMRGILDYRQDMFSEQLQELGYHLGRFIYIMDAYDDYEEDRQKGRFNPFLCGGEEKRPDRQAEEWLLDEMSAAAAAYQRLPCVDYADILGNILYAGVWNRFDDMQKEKSNNDEIQEGKKE